MPISKSADVVIVGTGVVGVAIAETLLDAGISVQMLEAGPRVSRAEVVENFRNLPLALKGDPSSCYPPAPWAPHPMPATETADDAYLQLSGPDRYAQTFIRYAGGSTWHWAGTCWRLTPDDMRLQSKYGVGRDWAFDYQALEPYYTRTEHTLGICGPADPALQWPPGGAELRSKPYPMPPLPFGPGEQRSVITTSPPHRRATAAPATMTVRPAAPTTTAYRCARSAPSTTPPPRCRGWNPRAR